MAKKTFHFEFEDESAAETDRKHDGITYEYSEGERLHCAIIAGTPFISGNSSGLMTLAKILVKISMSEYKDGFHVHLREDFNADLPEILAVGKNSGT